MNILPSEEIRITDGSTVLLHFEVSLPNGTIIDSTFGRDEPVTLVMGDESLLAGFEQVLINLKAGDVRTAHLSPTQAFGEWHDEHVQPFGEHAACLYATLKQPLHIGCVKWATFG